MGSCRQSSETPPLRLVHPGGINQSLEEFQLRLGAFSNINSGCHCTPRMNSRSGMTTASTIPSGARATISRATRHPINRLMMKGVHRQLDLPDLLVEEAGTSDRHVVTGLGGGDVDLLLTMWDRLSGVPLARDVLDKRAPERHVEHLDTPADAEDRRVASERAVEQLDLECIARRRDPIGCRMDRASAVPRRVDVSAAAEDEAVEKVQQRGYRLVLERQDEGNAARGDYGVRVGSVKRVALEPAVCQGIERWGRGDSNQWLACQGRLSGEPTKAKLIQTT